MTSMMDNRWDDEGYPAIYYQTIRDLGIDPVVCGPFGSGIVTVGAEGCVEDGSTPVQLAAKALAKASGAGTRAPRKRTPRKATKPAEEAGAKVPAQKAVKATKTARGIAKVASSG